MSSLVSDIHSAHRVSENLKHVNYSQTCVKQPHKGSTKSGCLSGCLKEVNISTKLKFGNILFGCLRQVGGLIEVTANIGLTVFN